jgi:hypothetical protein
MSTRYCSHVWPILQPQMIDEVDCGMEMRRVTDSLVLTSALVGGGPFWFTPMTDWSLDF